MFTMKYIDSLGVEWLEGGFLRTRATRNDGGGLVISGDRSDNTTHSFFQEQERVREPRTGPRLYVMNEQGVTVANYPMGAPSDAPFSDEVE